MGEQRETLVLRQFRGKDLLPCVTNLGRARKLVVIDNMRFYLHTDKGVYVVHEQPFYPPLLATGFVEVEVMSIAAEKRVLYFDPCIGAALIESGWRGGAGRDAFACGTEIPVPEDPRAWSILTEHSGHDDWAADVVISQLTWVDAEGNLLIREDVEGEPWTKWELRLYKQIEVMCYGREDLEHPMFDGGLRLLDRFFEMRRRCWRETELFQRRMGKHKVSEILEYERHPRGMQYVLNSGDASAWLVACYSSLGQATRLDVDENQRLRLTTDKGTYSIELFGDSHWQELGFVNVRPAQNPEGRTAVAYFDPRVAAALFEAGLCGRQSGQSPALSVGQVLRLPSEKTAWNRLKRSLPKKMSPIRTVMAELTWVDEQRNLMRGEDLEGLWELYDMGYDIDHPILEAAYPLIARQERMLLKLALSVLHDLPEVQQSANGERMPDNVLQLIAARMVHYKVLSDQYPDLPRNH